MSKELLTWKVNVLKESLSHGHWNQQKWSMAMIEREENIVKRIEELALLLGGTCQRISTANSMGRQSKKLVVEYDVTDNKQFCITEVR